MIKSKTPDTACDDAIGLKRQCLPYAPPTHVELLFYLLPLVSVNYYSIHITICPKRYFLLLHQPYAQPHTP